MKVQNSFAFLSLLVCVAFCIPYSAAQDLSVEKILNPLPDYNPFDQSTAPTPQFFPDEVDKHARDLLIDALINDEQALNRDLQFFKAQDARLQKERGTSTGLTAQAQDLVNNTIGDRERYLAAQKDALKKAATPERKKYLEAIINNDDLNQSDQLMRQSSTNFWAGMGNRLLSSVDLIGVASGNYIGAVAEDSSGYPDCRPEFYQAFQQVIDEGTKPETLIEIVTPVIHLQKSEIVRRGVELGAPLHLTWSCYRTEDRACGRCDSCALRLRAFREAGLTDPVPYA